jgi:hypothetical protein
MAKDFEQNFIDSKFKSSKIIGDYLYIIISVVSICVVILSQLGAFSFDASADVINVLVSAIPLLLVSIILTSTSYKQGVLKAKNTDTYNNTVSLYSKQVANLTGEQISALPDFSSYYNKKSADDIRKSILLDACFTIEQYNDCFTLNGVEYKPLKIMSRKELKTNFGWHRKNVVMKAKRVKVKGLKSQELLSEQVVRDETDLGHGEKFNEVMYNLINSIKFLSVSILTVFIVYRDVTSWGWASAGILLMKILMPIAGSIFSKIAGYESIIVKQCNRYNRKIDILKYFEFWYKDENCNKIIEK